MPHDNFSVERLAGGRSQRSLVIRTRSTACKPQSGDTLPVRLSAAALVFMVERFGAPAQQSVDIAPVAEQRSVALSDPVVMGSVSSRRVRSVIIAGTHPFFVIAAEEVAEAGHHHRRHPCEQPFIATDKLNIGEVYGQLFDLPIQLLLGWRP